MKTYIISMNRIPMLGICTFLGRGTNSSNTLRAASEPYIKTLSANRTIHLSVIEFCAL